KLQNELREPPKLKVVHPERENITEDLNLEPTLFEQDFTAEKEQPAPAPALTAQQQEALKKLTQELLELRSLLSKK
ncbi:MAG TPA: hypothetical protein VNK26_06220, partial [Pyrinomonadaceae bacterium]|nr:hypothetical protein [Pyrinomonadaceae bacterium]